MLLCAGHPFMIMLVLVCQTLVYKEITALFDLRDGELNFVWARHKLTGRGQKEDWRGRCVEQDAQLVS